MKNNYESMLKGLIKYINQMKALDVKLSGFTLNYNGETDVYIDLTASALENAKQINSYISAKITFARYQNENNNIFLFTFIDSFKFYQINNGKIKSLDLVELREFFDIEYGINLGDLVKQIINRLNEEAEKNINLISPINDENKLLSYLSNYNAGTNDTFNPNRKYLFAIRELADNRKRSDFMSEKSRVLNPKVYKFIKSNSHLTLCYSLNQEDQVDDKEVIKRYQNMSKKR